VCACGGGLASNIHIIAPASPPIPQRHPWPWPWSLALVAGLGRAGPLLAPLVADHLVEGAASYPDPVAAAGWLLQQGAGRYCFYAWKGSGTTARGVGSKR
jgi:hypothetical protein